LTLVEVLIIVAALLVLAAVLLLSLARRYARSPHVSCQNNLRILGLAFRTWEGDYNNTYPARHFTNADGTMLFADAANAYRTFQVMSEPIGNPALLHCPADKKRPAASDFGFGFSGANSSYFVGLDADETLPTRFLSGDRNITNGLLIQNGILNVTTNRLAGWTPERHQGDGNILFADGSVQHFDRKQLNDAVAKTGMATNRLAMP
jgi:prepilin-type processing-associated H-X9-DG protein